MYLTNNNGLLQVIKVSGFSFETADDDDLDIRKDIRNSLFKNMASRNVTLYFHTVRRRKPVMEESNEYSVDHTVKFIRMEPVDLLQHVSSLP